jgi:predicted HicB family RNase H-like nuclease
VTDIKHYAYRVVWSAEDAEYVATVAEFPSLSWLHEDQHQALLGLDRRFSVKFNVRVPESLHRELVLSAAEQGVSLNRLVSSRLAHA